MPLKKIISGGQTGVDRAGLDAALELGIPISGYCPKGRKAEDGIISDKYPLTETESAGYSKRTKLNVIKSDATIIFTRAKPYGGTKLTITLAKKHKKPFLVVYLNKKNRSKEIAAWIKNKKINTLNIAGPRESKNPGVYDEAKKALLAVIAEL